MSTAQRLASRFTLLRPLGSGGFGEVFLANDAVLGAEVALKRLSRMDPGSLLRFKREFRSIADVSHPNLVRLHELYADGDQWFFTMDYVPGTNLAEFLRGKTGPARDDDTLDERGPHGPSGPRAAAPTRLQVDEVRLRGTFLQIAQGLRALHAAGFLHRDLKPGNILVAADGHATILDLGLSAQLLGLTHDDVDREVVGTPGYMAPEQASGRTVSRATDWYSFGVLLFFALTGRLPWSGTIQAILLQQQDGAAPDPRRYAPAPDDLALLCARLLHIDPAQRPTGDDVIALLSGVAVRQQVVVAASELVGRDDEIAALLEVVDASRRERMPVAVEVTGLSGSGKTALVQRFVREAEMRHAALALVGRCYERESMPFKALDEVVDHLTQHLRSLPDTDAALLMPRDPHALARVFPVFGRIHAVQRAPEGRPVDNPQERRRAALRALRETLARLADRRPVILFIDDLQWADADSVQILAELLLPPDPPPVVLVFAYREEERGKNDILERVRLAVKQSVRGLAQIPVGSLSDDDAYTLVQRLLPDADAALVERIKQEGENSPYLVLQLCRAALDADAGASLTGVVAERTRGLPDAQRVLLEVISLAGGPIDVDAAARAAGLAGPAALAALGELRSALFVRTRLRGGRTTVEPAHDRIRESVAAALSAEATRATHERLARALEAVPGIDPEMLADHWRLGGDAERARPYVVAAATRAIDGLAFDRAAALFARTIETATDEERPTLIVYLAESLALAGRGREAGVKYREAAALFTGDESLRLRRLGAEKLLRSGAIAEGKGALQAALDHAHISLPESQAGAVAAAMLEATRLRLRGDREAVVVAKDPAVLERIDVCWAVATGLAGLDPLRGRLFATRHLRLALDAGDAARIGRGLALEGIFGVGSSKKTFARGVRLVERAAEVASRSGDDYAMAWARGAAACLAWYSGHFREAAELCAFAGAVLRGCRADTAWEQTSIAVFWHMPSLLFAGDLVGLRREAAIHVRHAVDRNDLYTEANLRTAITPWLRLLDDDPAGVGAEVDDVLARFRVDSWLRVHQAAARARCWSALYAGKEREAWQHIEDTWPKLEAGWLMKGLYERIFNCWMRGNVAVALARKEPDARAAMLRVAHKDIASLEADGNPWATAVAAALRAGCAAAAGDARAADLYDKVATGFELLDMPVHASSALRRRGELVGGEEGAAQAARADGVLRELGVKHPSAFSRVLVV